MDTRLLNTFLSLSRNGNFTATASELHLAQSTVTVQIRTLEKQLGARLFDRLPGGAELTAAGRRLLRPAEDLLTAEAALRTAAGADGPPSGEVTLAATESLCAYRLPELITALRREQPRIEIHLLPAGTALGARLLHTGQAQLALTLDAAPAAELTAEPLGHEPLTLVCAPEHRLAGRTPRWSQLARESFFLLEQGCFYSDRLAHRLLAVQDAAPRLTRFGSIEAARSCVAGGLGLGLFPTIAIRDLLDSGRLLALPLPAHTEAPVLLTHDPRRSPSPATHAVATALRAHWATGGSTP
ncbi:LysR family transcriptional regulator [Crossiella cryophila]|uniref:DNA-binding transcriptional LysR family regulator n=1 Tax=Crossiella cryophila TaxID=43355 RepID=A0A7W7CAW7_9PSEU|nr:LysR family transcriptional regulator [Crossiella cryophila]MBB4677759.1 DNA-binding transcriptional LysR family regulator [Crossiella cryophila]